MNLSDVIARIETDLPGFAWKVGTCCVSDDAWIVPDFNHPRYGEMLKRVFKYEAIRPGSLWDVGIDIDARPSGTPHLAMLAAYHECISRMKADGIWEAYRAEVAA